MTVVTNPARSEMLEDYMEEAIRQANMADEDISEPEELSSMAIEHLREYDVERKSDIIFVAGMNGDTWRFPGHRRVLVTVSPAFAALLDTKEDIITVDFVDRRGFEQLLRYNYCEPLRLTSVAITRCTLDAAYKFLCPSLAEQCARRLDEMLDAGVALDILRDLRYLCARLPGAASAPPLPALTNDYAAQSLAQCSRWCDSLAHNALLVLDENADEALSDERIEDLSYEDLALIVRRDGLRVSSEFVIAEALFRWSTAVCRRTNRELTPANKRVALGGLSYCPRYLLLQGEILDRALALELLEPMERALVLARARKLSAPIPYGADQEALLRHWARPRPTSPVALPVHLSSRSQPLPDDEPQPTKLCGRKPRRPRQPSFEPEVKKKGCCACFGEGLLRALICLFD